jgi:hypothetical protein
MGAQHLVQDRFDLARVPMHAYAFVCTAAERQPREAVRLILAARNVEL